MKESTYLEYCEAFARLAAHMHDNLDEEWRVQNMADHCCVSPYHFQRLFTRIAGESVGRLYRRLRLERAAWQLQNTSRSIADIGLDAGFSSSEAFGRAFKSAYACRANDFRRAHWLGYTMFAANGVHYRPKMPVEFKPMELTGCGTPYTVRHIEKFTVMGRRHVGPPGLMTKTWLEFLSDLKVRGFDTESARLVGFSPGLRRYMPAGKVRNHAGVPYEPAYADGLVVKDLGGGPCVVSVHEGKGPSLGDFWFRMWAEVMPASGLKQSKEVPFQVVSVDRDTGLVRAEIHIPVLAY